METSDIEKLFLSMLEDSGKDTDATRQVFSILIRSTLEYRDRILESKGIVITVEDVRTSLDWLIPAVSTGHLPETENKIQLDLLTTWLKKLSLDLNEKSVQTQL